MCGGCVNRNVRMFLSRGEISREQLRMDSPVDCRIHPHADYRMFSSFHLTVLASNHREPANPHKSITTIVFRLFEGSAEGSCRNRFPLEFHSNQTAFAVCWQLFWPKRFRSGVSIEEFLKTCDLAIFQRDQVDEIRFVGLIRRLS
jgi:hypothetical protein